MRPNGQEDLTEAHELEVLTQLAKQRKDAIDQYRRTGRDNLADNEAAELAMIEEYLPQALSPEEVEAITDDLIRQTGATSAKDVGKGWGQPCSGSRVAPTAGSTVQAIVQAKLSGS